jgi:Rps23 Pro-64 3,4-dihydroxylase Tpa1-like proline 4-hydroxylase
MSIPLFAISSKHRLGALRERFLAAGRVQVRDFLEPAAAASVRAILERDTSWGFAWQSGDLPPQRWKRDEVARSSNEARQQIARSLHAASATGAYAARFNSYPMLDAYLEHWSPGSPHDLLLEHINDSPFLDFVRTVTGIPGLIKADAQATLFAPGDYLGLHSDSHVSEGWRVAYVLNFADHDWKPDWGGYLNFFDEGGDIVEGWRPRFNVLNLLLVPQLHNVSYVPPFAPARRFAITGWLRDQ